MDPHWFNCMSSKRGSIFKIIYFLTSFSKDFITSEVRDMGLVVSKELWVAESDETMMYHAEPRLLLLNFSSTLFLYSSLAFLISCLISF